MARPKTDKHAAAKSARPHAPSPPKSGEGAFFYFFGFLITTAGITFAAAPEFSWQLTEIAQILEGMGIQSGVMIIGGLVLFGMGLLARSDSGVHVIQAAPGPSESESDFSILAEQITSKLAHMHATLLQVAEELPRLGDGQQAILHAQHEQRSQAHDPSPQGHSQEGLFRLAASLDKLNAHVDERIHGLDLQLRSGLDSIVHAVHQTRHTLESRIERGSSLSRSDSSGSAFGHSEPSDLGLQVLVDLEEDPRSFQPGPTSGAFLEGTMERLDAISGDTEEARGQLHAPDAPLPNLDPLDALLPDDLFPSR